MTVAVIVEVLTPSRSTLEELVESETDMASGLTGTLRVAVRVLPIIAVTVAVPLELLFSVTEAFPSLSVVAVVVTVPRLVANLTVLPTTGLPFPVSIACSMIVVASFPSAIIDDLLDVILRLMPRRVIVILPDPPVTVA